MHLDKTKALALMILLSNKKSMITGVKKFRKDLEKILVKSKRSKDIDDLKKITSNSKNFLKKHVVWTLKNLKKEIDDEGKVDNEFTKFLVALICIHNYYTIIYLIYNILRRFGVSMRTISIILFNITEPLIQEFFRVWLETEYKSGMYFSVMLSIIGIYSSYNTMKVKSPLMLVAFTTKQRRDIVRNKVKGVASLKYRILIAKLLASSAMQYVYILLQRLIIKLMKKKDQDKAVTCALIITTTLHIVSNALTTIYINRVADRIRKEISNITSREKTYFMKTVNSYLSQIGEREKQKWREEIKKIKKQCNIQ